MSILSKALVLAFLLPWLVVCASASPSGSEEVEWGPWYVILPFEHPDGAAQIAPEHSPERDLRRMGVDGQGPDLEAKHKGKQRSKLRWRRLNPASTTTSEPLAGPIRLAEYLPSELAGAGASNNAVAYLYRSVRAEQALSLPITLGSDDGCRVWLNGKLVHEFNAPRGLDPRDDDLLLQLKAGVNHLLVKVANGGGAWGFQMQAKAEVVVVDRGELQPSINAAIDRGVDYLVKTQQRDGSWGYHADPYRNGQTALSLYALLKSGVKYEHQAIRRGFEYLRGRAPHKTYSSAVQVLALSAARREQDLEWVEQLIDELVDWQQGDFGYPEGEKDLSCTQYGAFGYWIAEQHGIKVPGRAWTGLLRNTLKYHNDDGGFAYRAGGASTGSMTVAGLTVIAVCREHFGTSGFPKQWRNALEQAHESGLEWLGKNFRVDRNPTVDGSVEKRWHYYYLYGLERLGTLLGVDRFGEHDWYWEGAEELIRVQAGDGSWATIYGEGEPCTAFALLFLNRATASVSGPGASTRRGRLYATDGDDALVVLRAKGDTPLNLWISEIRPRLIKTHSRAGGQGEGLYLEAVEYFADGVSIARVEADSSKPWSGQTYATRHTFGERGEHEVRVRLHFAELPGVAGGRPSPIDSPLLKVRSDARLEDWMLDYIDDRSMNLVLDRRKQVSASSKRGDAHPAAKAFDGLQSTSWMCKPGEQYPSISVEFKKALRIDRIVLSHAEGAELYRGQFDLATKVEVDLGGKREPLVFDVEPDENKKTELVLPRKVKLSRLSLRVLERTTGSTYPGVVGFAEIELRLGEQKASR